MTRWTRIKPQQNTFNNPTWPVRFYALLHHVGPHEIYIYALHVDLHETSYNHTRAEQIGLPLRGPPILFVTRTITDRIGLHSVLLPLFIAVTTLKKQTVYPLYFAKHCHVCVWYTDPASGKHRVF